MGQYFVRLNGHNCVPYNGYESYRHASRDSTEFFTILRSTRFFGYKYNDYPPGALSGPDMINFTVPLDILYPNPQELIQKFTERNINKVKFLCQHFALEITLTYNDWVVKSDNEYDHFYRSIPSKFRTIVDGYGVRGSYNPDLMIPKGSDYDSQSIKKEDPKKEQKKEEEEGKLKDSLFKPKTIKLKQDE